MNGTLAIFTWLIIGVTACASYVGFTRERFLDSFIFSPVRVLRDRQYHRLITSGFLHANWPHLIFNMFSLYSFGGTIEMMFGPHVLLLIYFASILGGGLVSLYLHRHQEDYRALGASGGVCGIVFAAIFLLPGGGVVVWPVPFTMPSWLYAIVFILVSFFGIRSEAGNIGHDAHLGGAIVGLAVATVLYPSIIVQSPLLYAAVVLITAGLVVYAYKRPLYLESGLSDWRALWSERRSGVAAQKRADDDAFLDHALAKIAKSGMGALSASERKRLKAISRQKSRQDKQGLQKAPAADHLRWVENVESKE